MNALIERLGWMLLHSLWQGALVWLLFQLALIALRRKSAQTRYLTACFALALLAFLPWLTFGSLDFSSRLQSASDVSVSSPAAFFISSVPLGLEPESHTNGNPGYVSMPSVQKSVTVALMPWLVGAWILGIILGAVRLWISWSSVRRLVRTPLLELPEAWQIRLEKLRCTAGVRSLVRAGETTVVAVPMVVGWFKPLILLPLGVLTQLPVGQVEAILFHELAHIRRHDFLVNLLQNVIETLFFYHPAVRSISRRIRQERERVCDDLSVEWCRDPIVYAEALTTFEEYRQKSFTLAATGEGDLLARVRRIMGGHEPKQRLTGFVSIAVFLVIGGYLASMLFAPLLAAELMTDKERVATIGALQPPTDVAGSQAPGDVFVTGTLRTEDGRPLPKSLFERGESLKQSEAKVTSSRGGQGSTGGLAMSGSAEQTYYGNTQTGRIEVGVWAEGYAPARKTILQNLGGQAKADLILPRGFPAKVQIVDPSGKPLEGVLLQATSSQGGNYPLEISMPSVLTDASGMAVLGNVEKDTEIHLNGSKGGWQMMNQIVSQWSPGTPSVHGLEAARTTSGVVIDQSTRKPIAEAKIILAAQRGIGDSYVTFAPENGQVLARTDQNGCFNLATLAQMPGYSIYVEAKGYPVQAFPIDYGQQNRVCELSPGLHLKGKILDPKGLLKSEKYHHPIELQVMYTLQATPFNGYGRQERQSLAKLSPEIPFEFKHIPPGRIGLGFAIFGLESYRYELNLQKNTDDYVIDLAVSPPPSSRSERDSRPVRTLEISLETGSGEAPTGYVDADYLSGKGDQQWITPMQAALENGKGTLVLPVPTLTHLYADHLVGYWFAPQKFEVSSGPEPFRKKITSTRAGVIHGKVSSSGVFGKQSLSISPIVIKPPSGLAIKDLTSGTYRVLSSQNEYVTPPLPFGGTYAVVVDAAPSYFVSEPAVVDAEHPIEIRDLVLNRPTGILKGRFIDQAHQPIGYQEVMLTYHPDEDNSFVSHSATTDADGNFTISNLNFSVPGNYEVQLYGDGWEKSLIRINGSTSQPVIVPLKRR